MASMDSVAQNYQDNFGNYRAAVAKPVLLSATGNAVVALPLLNGGLSNNGQFILRRITVANPANVVAGGSVPNMSTANITILTSNDGNVSNAVTTSGGQTLANVTGANTYQDLTLVASLGGNTVTQSTLFVVVNTAVANSSVTIAVYGDVVNF